MSAVSEARNVLGGKLQPCGRDPVTGFYRDGFCRCGPEDRGVHSVCSVLTTEFLEYTKGQGNDLSTPRPEFGFPGLKPGDRWCLCVGRWKEAMNAGCAPHVVLESTSVQALEVVKNKQLIAHAWEASSPESAAAAGSSEL
ncbi:unnamed protein product [Phaeothamnion confervicola]